MRHSSIPHVLTPRQPDAGAGAVARVAAAVVAGETGGATAPTSHTASSTTMALGFAAARRRLWAHQCRHIAQAVMVAGGLVSPRQVVANVFALAASVAMLVAIPDVLGILRPPAAPVAIAPSSPSPYYLWVSLDTRHPEDFSVVFESEFWANRRGNVARHGGANASARAEMRLQRLARQTTQNEEDGVVWVERRRRFLTREFSPGERVGRYFLSHVTQLGHD